ncbi:hypothetical protein [Streptomyces sp. B15]|uniref:hypothetical protein n=1 Tax=Streptomyces sp. B15 TaxID=1537797 RepID=UPI001B39C9A0|nr:hypothetical protein [Streptomyces sp. B15]MBQ1122895.1 hypothetical protein [Streptomyces sp. B15]
MFTRQSVAVVAAGLVLTVGGCGGRADGTTDASSDKGSDKKSGKPAPTRPPSKKLVKWAGGMCESTAALKTVRKQSAADLKEIRKPDEIGPTAQHLAVSYLSRTPLPVEEVERDLEHLTPSGVPAADRLRDAWLKKLKRVVRELDKVSPSAAFDDAEGSAAGVDKLIQSLTSPEPGLPALMKKDPRLAAAHKRAEQCAPGWKPDKKTPAPEPSGPLPKAKDGKNTGACADGECEILVTSAVKITANGLSLHASAEDDSVTFRSAGSVMRLGGSGGVARFGDDLTITVVAQNEDGAVLKFTAP